MISQLTYSVLPNFFPFAMLSITLEILLCNMLVMSAPLILTFGLKLSSMLFVKKFSSMLYEGSHLMPDKLAQVNAGTHHLTKNGI